MDCKFPGCSKFFEQSSNRQKYCSNPHVHSCARCHEKETIAVKNYLMNNEGLCRACRKVEGSLKRKKSLESKTVLCRFNGCTTIFSPKGARNYYCDKTHQKSCLLCQKLFSTASGHPKEFCNTCALARGREKAKATNIERYGVDNPIKSELVKEKIRDTFLRKYGVENALAAKEIQEKINELR